MKKAIATMTSAAILGLGLSACGGGSVTLTPGPHPSSAPAKTQYIQIERLARPAIKEVFEPYQAHQLSNVAEPYADATMQTYIVATEDALRPPNTTLGTDYGKTLLGILYPDEYLVNLSGAAPSGNDPYYFLSAEVDKAFGGRAPNDDVIYLELGALFGPLLGNLGLATEDNEEDTCLSSQNIGGVGVPGGQNPAKLTSATFPYLPTPH
jgi:hypothetical protein